MAIHLGPDHEDSSLPLKDSHPHTAAHKKLLKILIQAAIRSGSCLRNIYWLVWRIEGKGEIESGGLNFQWNGVK